VKQECLPLGHYVKKEGLFSTLRHPVLVPHGAVLPAKLIVAYIANSLAFYGSVAQFMS
jgi:hypothetical protein